MDTENISRKKVILIGLVLLALIAIPVTVYVAMQMQQTTGKAAVPKQETVVAVINGNQITRDEAKAVASEQNNPKVVGTNELKTAVDVIAERKTLDKFASEKSITVTSAEIAKQMKLTGTSRENAKYAVLKQKVIQSEVKNWQVESIRFWIPKDEPAVSGSTSQFKQPSDLTAAEAKLRLEQLEDVPKFLTEAETLLKTTSALEVAQTLTAKYPSLSNIVAVNNSLISQYKKSSISASEYTSPSVYTEDELTADLYGNEIRQMQTPGEIKKFRTEPNGGGGVFKLISVNQNTKYASYEEFLQQEKAELGVNSLIKWKKLLGLILIFIASSAFFTIGARLTASQVTYPECLQFDIKFNATGWDSSIMWETMDVGCAGDYGSAGCSGGVKAVKPGQTVTLDRCTCTPYGDPRYNGNGCVVIGHNLKMEDYNVDGTTRRRVIRDENDPLLPNYCTLTVKGNTYDYRSTDFFPTKEQYDQDHSVTFCGVNGAEKDKEFSINCTPDVTPIISNTPTPEPSITPGVSTCPTPAQVNNVRVTCPNCYTTITPTPTVEQPTN